MNPSPFSFLKDCPGFNTSFYEACNQLYVEFRLLSKKEVAFLIGRNLLERFVKRKINNITPVHCVCEVQNCAKCILFNKIECLRNHEKNAGPTSKILMHTLRVYGNRACHPGNGIFATKEDMFRFFITILKLNLGIKLERPSTTIISGKRIYVDNSVDFNQFPFIVGRDVWYVEKIENDLFYCKTTRITEITIGEVRGVVCNPSPLVIERTATILNILRQSDNSPNLICYDSQSVAIIKDIPEDISEESPEDGVTDSDKDYLKFLNSLDEYGDELADSGREEFQLVELGCGDYFLSDIPKLSENEREDIFCSLIKTLNTLFHMKFDGEEYLISHRNISPSTILMRGNEPYLIFIRRAKLALISDGDLDIKTLGPGLSFDINEFDSISSKVKKGKINFMHKGIRKKLKNEPHTQFTVDESKEIDVYSIIAIYKYLFPERENLMLGKKNLFDIFKNDDFKNTITLEDVIQAFYNL